MKNIGKLLTIALLALTAPAFAQQDSFTIQNITTEQATVRLEYTENGESKTMTVNIGNGGKYVWNSPNKACLKSLSINNGNNILNNPNNLCYEEVFVTIQPAGSSIFVNKYSVPN